MSRILFFLLQLAILHCSCKLSIPENIDDLFANWFVNPTTERKKNLTSLKLSGKKLDSLALVIQSRETRKGTCSLRLYDQNKSEYTLGFATPENFIKDSVYPLIVYLHGGTNTTLNTKGEKAYKMFLFIADTIDIFIASPSADRTAPWWSKAGLNRILQTIRYMTLHFPIDPDRIFLAGVSDGATGCYAAANTINEPFAGFIAVSGFGGMLQNLGMQLYPSNLMQRPIYNINAGHDRLYPIKIVVEFLNQLEKNGVYVKRKIYPDEEHGFDYKIKETATLVNIINTWRRPDRSNITWTIVPDLPNLADNLLTWKSCNNESEKRIIAYWQEDTLSTRIYGICDFLMISDKKYSDKLFYKASERIIKPLRFQKIDTGRYLNLLQHLCVPKIGEKSIFRIAIK